MLLRNGGSLGSCLSMELREILLLYFRDQCLASVGDSKSHGGNQDDKYEKSFEV